MEPEARLLFLGCGVDVVYPSENALYTGDCLAKDCYYANFRWEHRYIPVYSRMRNRIIAGLALGTVGRGGGVEEADRLITADYAL